LPVSNVGPIYKIGVLHFKIIEMGNLKKKSNIWRLC